MEKIKNDTFNKFKASSIELNEVYGALGGPTSVATQKTTGWFWSDSEPDTKTVSDGGSVTIDSAPEEKSR